MAGFVGGAELVGGAGLALGLAVPLAGAIVIAAMLNVAVAIYRRNGRWGVDNGYEYPFVFAATVAVIGFTGAGAVSLDAWTGFGGGGVGTGLFTIGLGLLTGSAILVTRMAAESDAGRSAEAPVETPVAERLAA
jgi:putative oxidoreductase